MTVLRAYQVRDVGLLLDSIQNGNNPIYWCPTGGGKTVSFSRVVAEKMNASNWRCCIFVHRDTLRRQAVSKLMDIGITPNLITPQNDLDLKNNVHVAMIDTVRARIDRAEYRAWLASLDLSVFDEAHRTVSETYQRVIALCGGQRVYPTATPFRLDGRGLGEAGADDVVRAPSSKILTRMGYLAPIRVIAPPMPDLDRDALKVTAGDYNQRQTQAMMDNPERLRAIVAHYAKFAMGLPSFGFATGIDHASRMTEYFVAEGWRAQSVSGDDDTEEPLSRLAINNLQFVARCLKLTEGVDVPAVACAIDERPTASTMRFLQGAGRTARPHQDKSVSIYLDTCGNTAVHGLIDADRHWTIAGGVKGLEKQVTPTRRCVRCYTVHEWIDRCSHCGAVYPPTRGTASTVWHLPRIAGMRPEIAATMQLGVLAERARTSRDLEVIAQIKGEDSGWVARTANRLGIRPRP